MPEQATVEQHGAGVHLALGNAGGCTLTTEAAEALAKELLAVSAQAKKLPGTYTAGLMAASEVLEAELAPLLVHPGPPEAQLTCPVCGSHEIDAGEYLWRYWSGPTINEEEASIDIPGASDLDYDTSLLHARDALFMCRACMSELVAPEGYSVAWV